MNNTYHLSYDVFGTNIMPAQLQHFLAESRKVASWHQPFAGTVFIKSQEPLQTIQQFCKGILGESLFVLSLVNVPTTTGALSSVVWQWIYTDDAGFARLASDPTHDLLG